MEKLLGADLVERRSNNVALTDIGIGVARRGEQVLAAARDLEEFARHHGRLLTGRLVLGIIPTLAPYVLPRLLPALQRRHPNLRVDLRETQTKPLLDELSRGDIDVVLLALPVSEPDIETQRLFDDPFLLAVSADDPRPATKRVEADDIDQALAYCGTDRRSPLGLGATSLATVMQMVANGYGITLVPQVAADVEAHDERVKLLRFVQPQPGRTVGLGWRRTSARKADFVALGQVITEALGMETARPARRS
jgi:LysR family hydrogen peroxide-inducible transcriptional activator